MSDNSKPPALILGVPGFTYPDLYHPERLKDLHDVFVREVGEAEELITALTEFGIDLHSVTDKLQVDGVASFAQSFEGLLEALKKKRSAALSARLVHQYLNLGEYEPCVRSRLK